MLILLPTLVMLFIALTLVLLRFLWPNFKYPWLVAALGSILAVVGVFLWQLHLPSSFSLPAWQPETIFSYFPVWLADNTSWPYALALATLATAVIWTSVVRNENEPLSWAGTLLLSALGILVSNDVRSRLRHISITPFFQARLHNEELNYGSAVLRWFLSIQPANFENK